MRATLLGYAGAAVLLGIAAGILVYARVHRWRVTR